MKKLLRAAFALTFLAGATAQAQDLKGAADAGSHKVALCIGCHGIVGYKTGFPTVNRVPKIWGQNAKYIVTALSEYKRGERKHPSMRGVAETLSDQDMADLGAYFSSFGSEAAPAASASAKAAEAQALLAKGGCAGCHGADLNKPVDTAFPKLAGQYGDYVFNALKAYKSADKPMIGRGNPIMAGMAKQFSDAELQVLANYIESLPGNMATVQRGRFR